VIRSWTPLGVLGATCAACTAASAVGPQLPPFGLGAFDRQEPISIAADQLEAQDLDGRRTLSFRDHVQVRQGPLTLTARSLKADYAAGEKQPRSLSARGAVRIREGTRRALCDEAVYDRRGERILCQGTPAELWDGDDRLTGREIAFDLRARSVHVQGGTEVEIHREPTAEQIAEFAESEDSAAILERLQGRGPVTIRAAELLASDPGAERRILFEGDVRVQQDELVLRAGELEAVYPPEATRPERLVARRDVVVTEGQREARCEQAEYRIDLRRVSCEGEAVLRDGQDRLEGDRIALDLGARTVDAIGRARLTVNPVPEARE